MYTISVQAHYDAAHYLRDYQGKCARLHGHRYVVEVALQSPEVGASGMACDFGDLKAHLKELAERFDHQNLNEIPPFTEVESTAENQARYFYDELRKRLPAHLAGGLLYARVWESPSAWAQYGHVPVGGAPGLAPAG
jgi:6-pyruvoyltetrahydropterin/6-carboxytetrahydropterin synthase